MAEAFHYRHGRWFDAQSHNFTIGHGLLMREHGGFVIPPFQRALVWTVEQKVSFIESILDGLPIGTYVYNMPNEMDSPYENWLLDGQQRWSAIYGFVDDEFAVRGRRFSEFSEAERRTFANSEGFPGYTTRITDPDKLRDIFERLAYGGTPNVRPDAN